MYAAALVFGSLESLAGYTAEAPDMERQMPESGEVYAKSRADALRGLAELAKAAPGRPVDLVHVMP